MYSVTSCCFKMVTSWYVKVRLLPDNMYSVAVTKDAFNTCCLLIPRARSAVLLSCLDTVWHDIVCWHSSYQHWTNWARVYGFDVQLVGFSDNCEGVSNSVSRLYCLILYLTIVYSKWPDFCAVYSIFVPLPSSDFRLSVHLWLISVCLLFINFLVYCL